MIALLCPSRRRPEQLNRMVESAARTKTADIFKVYVAPSGDAAPINFSYVMDLPDNMPTAHKWNLLAEWAMQNKENNLFMLASDDMVFATCGWDTALIQHYNALENKIHVYALQDSRDKDGTPHIIVTREYIEAMGWFVPPYFLHWQIDSYTVAIAKRNNCFTHLRSYELTHDKPSDRGKGDDTHNRIRSWGWRERDEWVRQKLSGTVFGMDCERLKWALR